MAHFITAYILAAFCVAMSLQSTPFKKCSVGQPPVNLQLSGCRELPCLLRRGTNVTANVDFVVKSESERLRPLAKATLSGGITVDYPLPQQDACKELTNAECPLDKGEEATYATYISIAKIYPLISLNIEISLVNEKDEVQVCFSFDAKVVP